LKCGWLLTILPVLIVIYLGLYRAVPLIGNDRLLQIRIANPLVNTFPY